MIKQGLEKKPLNSNHTTFKLTKYVGYKELFEYFDGNWDYDFAVNMIKQDSRRYARKQLSWFNRDAEIKWFHPNNEEEIISFIDEKINSYD